MTKHGMCGAPGSTILPQDLQRTKLVWFTSVLVNTSHLAALKQGWEKGQLAIVISWKEGRYADALQDVKTELLNF